MKNGALNCVWIGWRANSYFLIVVTIYISIALAISEHWNITVNLRLYSDEFLIFGAGVAVVLFAIISVRVMLKRPPRLYPALRDRLVSNGLSERLFVGLPVSLVLPVFFSLFTSIKGGISRMVPFYADKILANLDRTIHGGLDPWGILQNFFGFGLITFVLNFLYNFWFVVMFLILVCVTFSIGNEKLRSQYLVSYVLTWILLGNLAATLGSSVGPAFVLSFYNDSTFVNLMDHLRATDSVYPVWALNSQRMLLAKANLDGPHWGSGISAFPSMHVAIAMLNAIYLWRFGSWLRWFGVVFLIAIQLGSVHLAWHYAVDGYASMLATPAIWLLAGWLSNLPGRRVSVAATAAP